MKRCFNVLIFAFLLAHGAAAADTLHLTNGDRLTGTLIVTNSATVEFESSILGRLQIPVGSIRQIETAEPVESGTRSGAALRAFPGSLLSSAQDVPGFTELWVADIDAAFSLTSGNADTRSVNAALRASRDTGRDRTSGYFNSVFANNRTSGTPVTTANAIRGGGRYEIDVHDRLFTFGFSDLEFDRFQGLDLRFVLGGGLGLNLVDRPGNQFQIFAGGSSNFEYFETGERQKSGEIVLGEEWIYRLTPTTTLEEQLSVFGSLRDVGRYRVTFDSTATTRINNWLAWQVTFSDRYLTHPRSGKQSNDLLFTTGIRITIGEGDLQDVGPGSIQP